MISLEKLKILTPLQKLYRNVGDLGKIIVAKSFKNWPKVQFNRPIWSHWAGDQSYSDISLYKVSDRSLHSRDCE